MVAPPAPPLVGVGVVVAGAGVVGLVVGAVVVGVVTGAAVGVVTTLLPGVAVTAGLGLTEVPGVGVATLTAGFVSSVESEEQPSDSRNRTTPGWRKRATI